MSDFAFRKKFSEQLSDLIEGDINLLEAIGILKRSFKSNEVTVSIRKRKKFR